MSANPLYSQKLTGTTASTSVATLTGFNFAAGDTVLVMLSVPTANGTLIASSLTDNATPPNVYDLDNTLLSQYGGANYYFYRKSNLVNVPTTLSAVLPTGSAAVIFEAVRVSGLHASAFVSAIAASGLTGSATTLPLNAFTTTNSNDFVFMGIASSNGRNLTAATGGFVAIPPETGFTSAHAMYLADAGAPGSKTSLEVSFSGATSAQMFGVVYKVAKPAVVSVSSPTATEGANLVFTTTLDSATIGTTGYTGVLAGSGANPADPLTDLTHTLATASFSNGVTFGSGFHSVPNGVTAWTTTIGTVDDALNEANETFTLTVEGVSGTGTITDNDVMPSVTAGNASESFGVVSIPLTLNTISGRDVSVVVNTANGTKVGGVDYAAISGSTVTITKGDLTKLVPVSTTVVGSQPLRFASPFNVVNNKDFAAAAAGYLNVRARVPFLVGSGDLSEIVLAFNAWNIYAGTINLLGNDYTVVSCAIERDSVAAFAPVTFSASRSKLVPNGSAEVLSDPVLPSAFGLDKFAVGTKLWIRVEYSVASAGLKLPRGGIFVSQMLAGTASGVLTSGAVVSAVDATGAMAFTSGFNSYTAPFAPVVLGRFVSGDPKTFIGIGDSIVMGETDTTAGYSQLGAFSYALTEGDHLTNPIGGMNFGVSGSSAVLWTATNAGLMTNYIKYAKYAFDEYQTNRIGTANGQLATAQSQVQSLWSLLSANGITKVVRQLLTPRTSGTDGTVTAGTAWSTGGDAIAFNNWLETPGTGTAQGVTLKPVRMNSMRLSKDPTSENFYRWYGATSGNLGTFTNDGLHPNVTGYAELAKNMRSIFYSLP